jgi:hypothetical protein
MSRTISRDNQPLRPQPTSPNVRPWGMDHILTDNATRETVERIALGIFTDMTNAGRSFQQSLAAVYLSGLKHAADLSREPT